MSVLALAHAKSPPTGNNLFESPTFPRDKVRSFADVRHRRVITGALWSSQRLAVSHTTCTIYPGFRKLSASGSNVVQHDNRAAYRELRPSIEGLEPRVKKDDMAKINDVESSRAPSEKELEWSADGTNTPQAESARASRWGRIMTLVKKRGDIEARGCTPIPYGERVQTNYLSIFTLWFSMSCNPLPYVAWLSNISP
jgi:hypothetical protein